MPANRTCPECGAVLPADAPRGLCPRCLALAAAGDLLGGSTGAPQAERPLVHYFGDYELLEEIARGGTGVVYRARQVSLNRLVAVKMILAGLFASDAERKRFRLEAETAARLNHPNIVEIYEVGEHQGQPYFSMRLVEGASLATRSARELSVRDAVCIMSKTTRAVHFAHQHGVLHRDLKPGNILLDSQGEPHITDFGLARLLERGSDLTLSGALLGSPAYMPPEQALGKAKHLTTAADVYGLGAVLYFLLTSQAPFTGATPVDIARRVAEEDPPSPRRFNPRLDPDLETICLKCLEKDPQRRYGSAEALADDLDRWFRYEPILARPAGALHRLGKWARREPRVAGLVGLISLSFAFGVGSVVYEWRQAEAARRQAESARRAAETHSARAEAAERDATEKLRDSYLAQAHANRLTAEPGRRYRSLEILAKAAAIRPGPELRDEAIACLALTDIHHVKTMPGPPGAVSASQPDDAWERYASGLDGGQIGIRRLTDDQELLRLPSPGHLAHAFRGFSHNGRFLAAQYNDPGGKCRLWDLQQRKIILTQAAPYGLQFADFRKGDEHFAILNKNGAARIFATATGRLLRSLPAEGEQVCLAYSPDGRWLAVPNGSALRIYDAETGEARAELAHPKLLTGLAWHPDSKRLATACHDRQVRFWDVFAGKELLVMAGHGEEVHNLAIHPDGELLVSSGFEGVMFWDLRTGERLFVLPQQGWNPKFSPDGAHLYGKQGAPAPFDLWDFSCNSPVRGLGSKAAFHRVKALAFSPDGRLLAFADGRNLRCLESRSGQEVAQVAFGEAGSLDFDAHGHVWAGWPKWGTGYGGVKKCALHPGAVPGTWALAPPEPQFEEVTGIGSMSGDGKLIAWPHTDHCRVFHTATAREITRTPGQIPCCWGAVSRDGRRLATGALRNEHVHIWGFMQDQTNLTQQALLTGDRSNGGIPQFSPDGRRLAVHWGVELIMYDTVDWKPRWTHRPKLPGIFVQALNGRLLAVLNDKQHIRLLATTDGSVLATLEMPNSMPVEALAFSPDSTLLAAASSSTDELFVWDLRAVRRELARLGLDWSTPSGPATAPAQGETNTIASTQVDTLEQAKEASADRSWKQDSVKPPDQPPPKSELSESPVPSLVAGRIPPRDPKTSPLLVDLGTCYNLPLDEPAPDEASDNHLGNLPAGLHQFANVNFDVRGRLQLRSTRLGPELPVSGPAIKVGLKCGRLHFLCAVAFASPKGTRVGTLLIRQGDHPQSEFGLVYGLNISDWWCGHKTEGINGPVVAWTGTNAAVRPGGGHLHLYKATWENPHPEQTVDSITFRSELTQSSPFLVAITAE
jgi:eukaryotic-like serine/threonine-protein kinase